MPYDRYRSFISSARWQRLRLRQLKLHPLCERCRKKGKTVIADEVHHILPCHDNPILQVAMSNLESLCTPCHAPLKADDHRGHSRELDAEGYATDPKHPSNRPRLPLRFGRDATKLRGGG